MQGDLAKLPRRRRVYETRPRLAAAPPQTSLLAFLETVYFPLKNSRPQTAESYRQNVYNFGKHLQREPQFTDLTDETVQRYVQWLRAADYAPDTINKHLASLLAVWRCAWRKGRVETLPRDIEFERTPKTVPECWSLAELAALLDAADRCAGRVAGVPARLYWRALILTAYYTGLRASTLLAVETTALDTATGWLTVPARLQKQNADQVFQLPPDALAAIAATDPAARARLLAGHGTGKKQFYRKLDRLIAAADLPHGRRDKMHRLRRTCATFVADAAGELAAQRHLGHSHVSVTRRYIDPRKLTTRCLTQQIPAPDREEAG